MSAQRKEKRPVMGPAVFGSCRNFFLSLLRKKPLMKDWNRENLGELFASLGKEYFSRRNWQEGLDHAKVIRSPRRWGGAERAVAGGTRHSSWLLKL